jgi:Zn-dependent peptidase ImmA (M78 family)
MSLDFKKDTSDTINLLPEDVKTFVNKIEFIDNRTMARDNFASYSRVKRPINITLYDALENLPAKYRRYVIAHEIAHAFLGHDVPKNKRVRERYEYEADELTTKWGFDTDGYYVYLSVHTHRK